MTYETFRYEVKKMGFYFHIFNDVIKIENVIKGNNECLSSFGTTEFETVCNIYTKQRFSLYLTHEFDKLDESVQEKLFKLIVALNITPLNERGSLYDYKIELI